MASQVARLGSNLPNGNFIPEVWSKKLQAKFYAETVLAAIANTDWEGEIKGQGSKVIIRVRPTINISDYKTNGKISYQDLADDKLELLIDKAKSFAFKVDDIDQAQSDIAVINEATQDAAEQMKIHIDKLVLGTVYADAASVMTSTVANKTNVMDWIVDAGTALDEQNVPNEGRWLVIPSWVAGNIKKSDLRDAAAAGDSVSIVRNGRLGIIDRFTIYSSNNMATDGTTWQALAGHKVALSFASQFVKTETLRLQDTFGNAVRGLNVFGFKVTKPEALVSMPCTKT